jgi:multiple sugar transport system substrate-binding protein
MKKVLLLMPVAVVLLLLVLGGSMAAQSDPITIWIDTTRQAAVDLYLQTFPEDAELINVEIVDRSQFPAKVLLFNNAGSGWPDVVFAEPELVGAVADASRNFPLDLNEFVTPDILENFAPGANAPCTTPDGKLVCLRNDLAHNVLWYNKPLMDEFGYEIPTTWEEYEALGERVVEEHPGYIIGAFGDDQGMHTYLWPSGCPTGQAVDALTVYINTLDPNCIRAVEMVDRLLAMGALAKLSPFDPAFVELVNQNMLLMLPAASWYGEYVFGGKEDSLYYKTSEGQLGVALPPRWSNEDVALTGAQGGAAWTVSRHTLNPELAVKFVVWVTTDNAYQGTAPTFPAYLPAAEVWSQTISNSPLYATDPFPILNEAAGLIDPRWGNVRYNRQEAFTSTVIPAIVEGNTVASALEAFQAQLVGLAQSQGYAVVTEQ